MRKRKMGALWVGFVLVVLCVWGTRPGLVSAEKQEPWLAMLQLKRLDALVLAAKTFLQQSRRMRGRVDFQRVETVVRFLKGNGGKMLGLRWREGAWLHLSMDAPKDALVSKGWASHWCLFWEWERALWLLQHASVTAYVPLRSSFLLRLGIRRSLKMTHLPFSVQTFGSQRSYWLRLPGGGLGVVVITNKALLARVFWQPPLSRYSQRYLLWSRRVQPVLRWFQGPRFRFIKQRLANQSEPLASWKGYLRTSLLRSLVSWLGWSLQGRKLGRDFDGVGLAGWFRGREMGWTEVLWKKKPSRPAVLRGKAILSKWATPSTRFLSDIGVRASDWEKLAKISTLRPFLSSIQHALRRLWRSTPQELEWISMWSDIRGNWRLSTLLGTRLSLQVHAIPSISSLQPSVDARKEGGQKVAPQVLLGEWNPQNAAVIASILSNMPNVSRFDLYGHTPYFVLWENERAKAVFSWRGSLWVLANDFGTFHVALENLARPKAAKRAKGWTRLGSRSLVHLREEGSRWQILRWQPSSLSCCWFGCEFNRQLWGAIQRVPLWELALQETTAKLSVSGRILWRKIPASKTLLSSCHAQTPLWKGAWRLSWMPWERSFVGEMGAVIWSRWRLKGR